MSASDTSMLLLVKRRDDRAGRRCTIGNRVCAKSVPRVRIPISPPEEPRVLTRDYKDEIALSGGYYSSKPQRPHRKPKRSTPRGGVAEWLNAAVSKTVLPVTRVTRVRIPPPPPVNFSAPLGAFFVAWLSVGWSTVSGQLLACGTARTIMFVASTLMPRFCGRFVQEWG